MVLEREVFVGTGEREYNDTLCKKACYSCTTALECTLHEWVLTVGHSDRRVQGHQVDARRLY